MSAASSRRLAKPSLALGPSPLLPPAQQSVMQKGGPLPPMGGCGNTLSSAPPSRPHTVSGYSSNLTSFPCCLWCHRDAESIVPALHITATAWHGHSKAFMGGLSAQISLLCTRWGAFKVPSLSLKCQRA